MIHENSKRNCWGGMHFDGVSERALFFIDKEGIIQDIRVNGINKRPDLDYCVANLEKMHKK